MSRNSFTKKASPALVLLTKLNGYLNVPNKARKVRLSADACMTGLRNYVNDLKVKHCKNTYQTTYLASTIFQKPRVLKNDAEIMAYYRANLFVAADQLQKLIDQMRGKLKTIPSHSLKAHEESVRDYLFDLKPIVEYMERKHDKSYSFFEGRKAYGTHAWRVFRAAQQLAVMSHIDNLKLEHHMSQITACVVLRQALELKFAALIGVRIMDQTGQTPKVRHDFNYRFIKDNAAFFEFKAVDFALLESIYDWCNIAVHRVIQPLAWQLPYALKISSGLFVDGPSSKQGDGWSIHGGVYIDDVAAMQSAFALHFTKSYQHGLWCVGFYEPEAACTFISGGKHADGC